MGLVHCAVIHCPGAITTASHIFAARYVWGRLVLFLTLAVECAPVILRLFLLVAVLALFPVPKQVMADMPMFSAREGIAIGGYDTVAYFETGDAVAGKARYSVIWKGVTWRFASERNQLRFEMNPRAYAPRFGGYCAFAMSMGRLTRGDPKLWVIVDGELFLLNSAAVRDLWQARAGEMIAEARNHWPRVLRQ